MLKDLYHLKPGWLRKPLFSFFGSYYFYLREYSLSCLQLFQFNSMTKTENSILKAYQCPGIICSICLAISYFSTHNKNEPSLTRLLSVSLNPKAVYKLLEHSLHISSQIQGRCEEDLYGILCLSVLSLHFSVGSTFSNGSMLTNQVLPHS